MSSSQLKKHIKAGLVLLMPPHTTDQQQRSAGQSRIFVAITLIIVGINTSAILYFSLAADLPTPNTILANITSSVVMLSCFTALIIYRTSGSIRIPAFILSTILYIISIVAIVFLGGPLEGVTLTLMFVPPLIAFVFAGFVPGMAWALLSYLALLISSLAQIKGVEFPFISTEDHKHEGRLVIWHFAFFSVFCIVAFYEFSNARYRKLLEKQAHNDPLTGLANRTALNHYFQQSVLQSRRSDGHFAVIYIDLDDFKPINDQYGHRMGDEVLRVLGTRISGTLRKGEFCGRIGGDEFVVLASSPQESLQPLVERLEKTVQEPIHINNQNISLTASMGVALFPKDGHSIETLIDAADSRMYKHKLSKNPIAN